MTSLWRRLRDAYRRSERRRDEIAGEKVILDHEQREREKVDPDVPLPSMRERNDWAEWSSPL